MGIIVFLLSCSDEFSILMGNYDSFVTNQSAFMVLGNSEFDNNTGGTTNDTFSGPSGIIIIGNKIFLADQGNNRILGFNSIPSTSGSAADFVMGQPDFTTSGDQGVSSSTMSIFGIASDDSKLFLSDYINNRILIFNTIPNSDNPEADIVVGQTDMTSNSSSCSQTTMNLPFDVAASKNKMVVSDYGNNRILVYNSIPTSNNTAADFVLGQPDFDQGSINAGLGPGSPTDRTLFNPGGIWTDGNSIIIADGSNSRVLIWKSWPVSNYEPADIVIGQPDFTTSSIDTTVKKFILSFYSDITVSKSGKLYISDSGNNRVLIYNTIPTNNYAAANIVLGQENFTNSSTGLSENTFNTPAGLFFDENTGQLYVTEYSNNRVLVFKTE